VRIDAAGQDQHPRRIDGAVPVQVMADHGHRLARDANVSRDHGIRRRDAPPMDDDVQSGHDALLPLLIIWSRSLSGHGHYDHGSTNTLIGALDGMGVYWCAVFGSRTVTLCAHAGNHLR